MVEKGDRKVSDFNLQAALQTSRIYTEAYENALSAQSAEVRAESKQPSPQWHGPTGALAPVMKWCRFIQHCHDDIATLSEGEWWAMASNLARLAGGREAVHALSGLRSGYSQVEIDRKIEHALKAFGPLTCAYIQEKLGFTGCPPEGCGIKAPAGLGVSRRAIAVLEARARHAVAVAQACQRREAALVRAQTLLQQTTAPAEEATHD